MSAANTAWNRGVNLDDQLTFIGNISAASTENLGVSLDDQLFFTATISAARTARNLGSTLDDPRVHCQNLCDYPLLHNDAPQNQEDLTQKAMQVLVQALIISLLDLLCFNYFFFEY